MKQSKHIATVLAALAITANASAYEGTWINSDGSFERRTNAAESDQEYQKLEAKIQKLYEAGAIEIDENGKLRVKRSVVEELKQKGRHQLMSSSAGSICN